MMIRKLNIDDERYDDEISGMFPHQMIILLEQYHLNIAHSGRLDDKDLINLLARIINYDLSNFNEKYIVGDTEVVITSTLQERFL
ncbi:hypothetical protein [Endozoicomonas sp. ALB115]|uniref:hypothetical protein n=1 Tax=Endozoicomonas sp. ALB115 TaxID=3403074 RepID=UPI003BB51664